MKEEPKKTPRRRPTKEIVYGCSVEDIGLVPVFITGDLFELWGYHHEEVIGDPNWWAERLHPDEHDEVLDRAKEIFIHGVYTHEYRFRHNDGSYRWVYDRLRLVRDSEGRPVEIVGSWLDVTEFKVS